MIKIKLKDYTQKIKKLPIKDTYAKEDLLISDFKIYEEGKMSIFYAPHNEYINKEAKVLIVGICPGWTQTKIAINSAKKGLENNEDLETISKNCKMAARFAGTMRLNLIKMLDEIKLNEKLKIPTCADLFTPENSMLHTTSLIPYPVFISGKNYTGHNPQILDSPILSELVAEHFYKEVNMLKGALIIPLGKAVEEVLRKMINDGIISEDSCLFNFPHPSGANGHRQKQFLENKTMLTTKVDNFFNK